MKQKKILHILSPDKFTIPFIRFVNKEFDSNEHLFLCVIKPDDELLSSNSNVRFLHTGFRKNIINNTLIFYESIRDSSKIMLHGNPNLYYFILFPWVLKKTYWIIYGYEIANSSFNRIRTKSNSFHSFIKSFVLKRVYGHITHIEGDSELANSRFKSRSKFFYSPMYLSNVVIDYKPEKIRSINKPGTKKILVGNSTSPTNSHASIFKMLLPYQIDDITIYCPLSYGIFHEYRDEVINTGKDLFGEKFVALTNFMKPDEYKSFLEEIDTAIFNHNRQEGMGVTLALLSMSKIVYMSSETTSFKSLTGRGFKVFDNMLIEREGLHVKRDVSVNAALAYKYYSYEKLKSSLAMIFSD